MPVHEHKICPRCERAFECKVGDISHCQCNGIHFTAEEKAFIASRYQDCLCAGCLLELKDKSIFFKEKFLH